MALLAGKRGLIVGIANERSLAYGIARATRAHGAALVLTYQGERLLERVHAIAGELGAETVVALDVTRDQELSALTERLRGGPKLDFIVHAVAQAQREELDGRFLDTSREGFHLALEVSVYSLVALVRAVEAQLAPGAS